MQKSSNDCSPTVNGDFTVSKSVIYEGADIKMTANSTSSIYTYKWSGPGGWTSEQITPTKTNMQVANSGTYIVEVLNFRNCVEYRGTKYLQVLSIPDAPCSITSNTIQGNVPGFNNVVFSFASWYPNNGSYYATVVTPANDRIDIRFPDTNTPPSPGIYKTRESYMLPAPADQVNIIITVGSEQYRSMGDGEVYIKPVGGKLQISFCNQLMFKFPNLSLQYTLTAKISQ